jgi:hypothetical protein
MKSDKIVNGGMAEWFKAAVLKTEFVPFRKPYKFQEILLPANGLARF